MSSEALQVARVYRNLLKAVKNHVSKEDKKKHFREYVTEEFRKNSILSDLSSIQQKIKLASDYTFLLNSVHHQKVLLIHCSYCNLFLFVNIHQISLTFTVIGCHCLTVAEIAVTEMKEYDMFSTREWNCEISLIKIQMLSFKILYFELASSKSYHRSKIHVGDA